MHCGSHVTHMTRVTRMARTVARMAGWLADFADPSDCKDHQRFQNGCIIKIINVNTLSWIIKLEKTKQQLSSRLIVNKVYFLINVHCNCCCFNTCHNNSAPNYLKECYQSSNIMVIIYINRS